MATSSLDEKQIQRIKCELCRGQSAKDFYTKYAELFGSEFAAARRWFERLVPGKLVPANRMAALIKTFAISVHAFETAILDAAGFCKENYGSLFVEDVDNYVIGTSKKPNPFGVSPFIHPTVAASHLRSEPSLASRYDSDFDQFFGPAMKAPDKHVHLVFPKRTLKDPRKSPFDLDQEYDCKFEDKEGKTHSNVLPEGITGYLGFEDVRAAIHVANFVADRTKKEVWIRHDTGKAFDTINDNCTFAFGLGFTGATRNTEEKFENNLFSVYCDKARDGNYWTDYFRLKFPPDAETSGATPTLKEIPMTPKIDVALIVRAIRRQSGKVRSQPWYICAGRTAIGTCVAAHFLTKNFQKIAKLYRDHDKSIDHDTLALVINHKRQKSADRGGNSPDLVEDTADWHYWDDAKNIQCIAWS